MGGNIEQKFEEGSGPQPVTLKPTFCEIQIEDTVYKIIDLPGVLDGQQDILEWYNELIQITK